MKFTKFITIFLLMSLILSNIQTSFATSQLDNMVPQSNSTRAIVIIPGILGSELQNTNPQRLVWVNVVYANEIGLNESGTSINRIEPVNTDNFGARDTYQALFNRLNNAFGSKFDVIFFDYDWRMSINSAANLLNSELSGYSEVVLVAHSMGGLVASRWLKNSSTNRNKTSALITLGTPFVGSAKCLNVMETGELITLPGLNITIFSEIIKNVSKNSYAAYQLLPTNKYYAVTSQYPLSINGNNNTNVYTTCQNCAWAKNNNGTAKPMLNSASAFHNALYNGTSHVINFSDVTTYTFGATGQSTISRVNMNSNYGITGLNYNNSGDGTVLLKSAGHGTPDFTYSGVDHTSMVSNSTILNKVVSLISAETGVSAQNSTIISEIENNDAIEISPSDIQLNDKGWIVGENNKRINLYTEGETELLINGGNVYSDGEKLYNSNNELIGNVWSVGNTGRKLYALLDGDYTVSLSGDFVVEYMNNGYFDKGEEFAVGNNIVTLNIGDYTSQEVTCELQNDSHIQLQTLVLPTHIYSEEELNRLNQEQ